jgi:hypothetical protein
MLARLLAAENISVVHENTPTAFFDLKSRSLHLPLWSNANGSLYDMLVGHEVAHALWTNPGDWGNAITYISAKMGVSDQLAKSVLNIVEDARIERLIQTKFRGLRADFVEGYRVLADRKFFGDISEINSAIFPDRVNIHFKCGIHSGTLVRFNGEEQELVTRMGSISEWHEVISCACEMLRLTQLEREEREKNKPQAGEKSEQGAVADDSDTDAKGVGGEGESEDSDRSDGQPGDTQGDDGEETTSSAGSASANPTEQNGASETGMLPQTQQAFEAAMERMGKDDAGGVSEVIRVRIPDSLFHAERVDHGQILDAVRRLNMAQVNTMLNTPVRIADYTTAAAAMATAFNRRKAADQWRRTNVAKTGSLCTLRMNGYRWNEDIFRRSTRVADGKNHGITILLDWSGSMHPIMASTLGQLFIITDFCRKTGVPFEVLAFTDQPWTRGGEGEDSVWQRREAQVANEMIVGHPYLTLLNFLSNRMNGRDYEAMKSLLWNYRHMGYAEHRLSLGGTPLTTALFAMAPVMNEFMRKNRIQIGHTIVLTDGDPTDQLKFRYGKWQVSQGKKPSPYGCEDSSTAIVLDDPQTGRSYDMKRVYKRDAQGCPANEYHQFGNTPTKCNNSYSPYIRHMQIAVDVLRARTGCRVHWIGLTTRASQPEPKDYGMTVTGKPNWKRDGYMRGECGNWDTAVVVDASRFLRSGTGRLSERMENTIRKAEEKMENAKTDRALATAFIDSQVAQGSLRSLSTIIGEYIAVA